MYTSILLLPNYAQPLWFTSKREKLELSQWLNMLNLAMKNVYLLLQTGFFPSVCFGPYFWKAVHKKWCCHKLGVVPVFKGLHGNWDTVHLGEEVVSWRGDILMPMEICNSENRAGHVTCEMVRQEVSNIQASWLFTLLPHNIGQWAYVGFFLCFLWFQSAKISVLSFHNPTTVCTL